MGVRLAGDLIDDIDEHGRPIRGDTVLMLLNAHHEAIQFVMPRHKKGQHWESLLDTARPHAPAHRMQSGVAYDLRPRSSVVLHTRDTGSHPDDDLAARLDRDLINRKRH